MTLTNTRARGLVVMPDAMEDRMDRPLSKYVRDCIKALPFNDRTRRRVHDLLHIESFAVHPPRSWTGGMFDDALRRADPAAYAAIHAELNKAKYECEQRDRARRLREAREDHRRHAAAERRKREDDRRLWAWVRGDE
jgi:hypothetical protein